MNDVLEVLDELGKLIEELYAFQHITLTAADDLYYFSQQKRSEYEEPKGDCCG